MLKTYPLAAETQVLKTAFQSWEVNMSKRFLLLATALVAFGLAGCGARIHAYGYVTSPPPPPRVEAFGVAPGPGFVWLGGYWRWGGNGYLWTPGHWARPPRRGARWAPGRWEQRHGRYYWHDGRWR